MIIKYRDIQIHFVLLLMDKSYTEVLEQRQKSSSKAKYC